MNDWFHDLRYGVRTLVKNPGFAAISILTLAIGIGANTAIFTVLDAVMLRSLPYRAADRLGVLWVDFGEHGQSLPAISSLDFRDFQEMSTLFEGLAAGSGTTVNLTGTGDPEQVDLGRVTYNFFSLLGVEPALGRGFLEREDVMNGPEVVILSHGLWQRRFGGDPSIVGRTVDVNGTASRVVGVMPSGFELYLPDEGMLRDSDLWAPLQDPFRGPRNRTLLTALARLRENVSFEQAQEEVTSFAGRLREEHLVHHQSDTRIRLVPLHRDLVKNVRPALLALFGAVVLVLCVACGTVANLLLARMTVREREIALRASLGAGRGRIIRQLLTESAILSVCAGGLGLLLARLGTDLLLSMQSTHLPRVEDVSVGGAAFTFTAAACAVTVLLFGVLPAVQASRPRLYLSLREGGATGAFSARDSLRRVFVALEVALALVLLIGVSLLMRSFVRLEDVRPGFDAEGVLTFRVSLPSNRYPSAQERLQFHDELQERLEALPGVRSVGAISWVPLGGGLSQAPYAYDAETERNWESVTTDTREVTQSFFETAGVRLQAGRLFDDREKADSRLVIIVDDALARKAWPEQEAVGQRLMLPVFGPDGIRREWLDVVGVVEHVHLHDVSEGGREQVFFSFRQDPSRGMDVMVRVDGDPAAYVEPTRRTVRAMDADLPFHNPRPLSAYVSDAMAQERFTLVLSAIFGSVALVLATIAVYGLVSYIVSRRAHEFGIRIALGARASGIFRLVMQQGLCLVMVGVAVGVPGALIATRAISSMLFGVSATDPTTYIVIPLLLTAVALLACYVPARRATRVDPVVALRSE